MPKLIGYVIGRASEGSRYSMKKEYLTPDGHWAWDVKEARVFDVDDWCLAPEEKGTDRYGRHRADVECDLQKHGGRTCYVMALMDDHPRQADPPFTPGKRNRFAGGGGDGAQEA